MKRSKVIKFIVFAFAFLYLYTAFSKLMVYDRSLQDLERSPFISQYAVPLSILLPVLEIGIAVLLLIPKYRRLGLIASLGLMIAFTTYVTAMVFTLKELPCSCGGLIRELTWKQHFFFNIFVTLMAILGLYLHIRENRPHNRHLIIHYT